MRFDMICDANGIEHRLTKPNHPWTNGQVERMNRTIKEGEAQSRSGGSATAERQTLPLRKPRPVANTPCRLHLASGPTVHRTVGLSLLTYNFVRRLKTLSGLTPYEYICKIWTSEPDRFILNPIHQMPALNT
jgi:transposase InsO family protein